MLTNTALDNPEMAKVALQCRQVVEEPMLAGAAQQPLRLVKGGLKRSVWPNDVHHWIHITLHPMDDTPELVAD